MSSATVVLQAFRILQWAEQHVLALRRAYPRRPELTDNLPLWPDSGSGLWALHPDVFDQIYLRWRTLDVDPLVSPPHPLIFTFAPLKLLPCLQDGG